MNSQAPIAGLGKDFQASITGLGMNSQEGSIFVQA